MTVNGVALMQARFPSGVTILDIPMTFTALNDRFTTHTWAEVGLGPNDLTGFEWTDFEVVEPDCGET